MFHDKMFYVFASLSFIYIIFMTGKKNPTFTFWTEVKLFDIR